MKPIRPWEKPEWRLGLKLGPHYQQGVSGLALGWAVLGLESKPSATKEMTLEGRDPAQAALETYRREAAERGAPEIVTLYRYSIPSFRQSVPASEGMTLADHSALVARTAKLFRDNGIVVEIEYK